jgi:ubiquinone/menaquinone biosynthesis C-methylase UbiE
MNSRLKQAGKKIVKLMGAIPIMDELNFRFQQIWFLRKNKTYKQPLKRFVFPTDRALFNTFQLDHKRYYEDGLLAAQEMIDWGGIKNIQQPVVLDWGCGTGRVIRHIPHLKKEAICYGADIDCTTIQWCRQSIESVYFDCIEQSTLPYPSNYFHLVYGISVLTHIPHTATHYWLNELNRVLLPNGIAILSTHGTQYFQQLSNLQQIQLQQVGAFTNSFKKAGHRSLTSYHAANHLKEMLQEYFSIVQFWEGKQHPEKMGGQDCWIIKKIPATNGNRD